MDSLSKINFKFVQDKLSVLEMRLDQLNAYFDQKIDEITMTIDELESRINNLR